MLYRVKRMSVVSFSRQLTYSSTLNRWPLHNIQRVIAYFDTNWTMFRWQLHNVLMTIAQYLDDNCTIFRWQLHNIWMAVAQYLDDICTIFGWQLHNIWMRVAQYLDDSCAIFEWLTVNDKLGAISSSGTSSGRNLKSGKVLTRFGKCCCLLRP